MLNKDNIKISDQLQDVIYKCSLSGEIVADPGTTQQTLLAYSRLTGEFIGTTVWEPETKTYKLYLPTQPDESIMLTRRDDAGTYFAETYDRLTQANETFVPGPERDDLFSSKTILSLPVDVPRGISIPSTVEKESIPFVGSLVSTSSLSTIQEGGVAKSLPMKVRGTVRHGNDFILNSGSRGEVIRTSDVNSALNINPFSDGSCLACYPLSTDASNSKGSEAIFGAFGDLFTLGGYYVSEIQGRRSALILPFIVNRQATKTISFKLSTQNYYTGETGILNIPDLFELRLYETSLRLRFLSGVTWTNVDVVLTPFVNTHQITVVLSSSGTDYVFLNGVQVLSRAVVFPTKVNTDYVYLWGSGIVGDANHKVVVRDLFLFNRALTLAESVNLRSTVLFPKTLPLKSSVSPFVDSIDSLKLAGGGPDSSKLKSNISLKGNIHSSITSTQDFASMGGVSLYSDRVSFNGTTGYLWRGTTKGTVTADANIIDESNIDVAIRFNQKVTSGIQCLWKSGDNTNGIAIGIDATAHVTLYARNSGVLTTSVFTATIAVNTWYSFTVVGGNITLYSAAMAQLETKAHGLTFGNYTGQESVGAAITGSPITGVAGDSGFFNGDISDLVMVTKNTLAYTPVDSEKSIAAFFGEVELPVEVVKWDVLNNSCVLWTTIPELDASEDTVISIRNGKPTKLGFVGSIEAQKVWDQNFKAVYHMVPGTELIDSTANHYDGVLTNIDVSNFVSDITGYALDLNGTDEFAKVSYDLLKDSPRASIFASIRNDALSNGVRLLDASIGGSQDNGLQFKLEFDAASHLNAVTYNNSGELGSVSSGILGTTDEHMVVMNYNGRNNVTAFSMLSDGVQSATDSSDGSRIKNNSVPLFIGRDAFANSFYNGKISELFISNKQRSSSFMNVVMKSMKDELGTYVVQAIVSEVPWTPEALSSVQVWNNANSTNKVVLESEKIASWVGEVTGTQTFTQSNPTYRPSLVSGLLNGKPGVVFSAAGGGMLSSGFAHTSNPNGVTVAFLVKVSSGGDALPVPFSKGTVNTEWLTVYNKTTSKITWSCKSAAPDLDPVSTYVADTVLLVVLTMSSTLGMTYRIFGVNEGSVASPSTFLTNSSPMYIGNSSGGANTTLMTVFEFLVINSVLPITDIQKLEGYLAWGWGVAGSLGLDHPYRLKQPKLDAVVSDPYWDQTVLAMTMNGVNNSTAFIELKGKSVSGSGNVKISTAKAKFGDSSAYFDGSGDCITAPASADFAFGSGNFTIEMWVFLLGSQSHCLFDSRASSVDTNGFYFGTSGSDWQMWYGVLGFTSGAVAPLNQWCHVALCRDGDVHSLFIDGLLVRSVSLPGRVWSSNNFRSGVSVSNGESTFGYVDDIRIIKGVAKYTSTFTPPGEITIPEATEYPDWNETTLALPLSGAVGSSVITDLKDNTVTALGGIQITAVSRLAGGTSLLFDGVDDYLTIPTNAGLTLGTGDFTIDFWMYANASGTGTHYIFDIGSNGGTIFITKSTSSVGFYNPSIGTGSALYIGKSVQSETWVHVRYCRVSGILYGFVNGLLYAAGTDTFNYTASTITIGRYGGGGGGATNLRGSLSDFRVVKGVGVSTANFIPPTWSYSVPLEVAQDTGEELLFTIPSGNVLQDLSNVPVMMQLSDSSGITGYDATQILDSAKSDFLQFTGDAKIAHNFGSIRKGTSDFNMPLLQLGKGPRYENNGSFVFVAATPGIDVSNSVPRSALLGDLTCSLWVYPDAVPTTEALLFGSTGIYEFQLLLGITYCQPIVRHSSSVLNNQEVNCSPLSWSHVIVTRSVVLKRYSIYVNGILFVSGTFTTVPSYNANTVNIGSTNFVGKISDIKLYSYEMDANSVKDLHNETFEVYKDNIVSSNFKCEPIITKTVGLQSIALSSVGTVFCSVSFDNGLTYKVNTGTWHNVASTDPAVHGHVGDSNAYYWDIETEDWVYSGSDVLTAISTAVSFVGNQMVPATLAGITDFSSVFVPSTGYLDIAISLYSDGTTPTEVSKIVINNKSYWVSEEYNLPDYCDVVAYSNVNAMVFFSSGSPEKWAGTKIYCMLNTESTWTECSQGQEQNIPNIPIGMPTSGKKARFMVVWDMTVWDGNPEQVPVEFSIK